MSGRRMLRASRTLEAALRGAAGPSTSRLYATSTTIQSATPGEGGASRHGQHITVMGTPSPIPKITEVNIAHPTGNAEQPWADVIEEPVFQPPPMLELPSRGYLEPQPLAKTHGIPVAILHLRSYHIRLLDLFIHFALHSAVSLGIPTSKAQPLKTQRRLWTVIKGPFVHKKTQENFVRLTHKRAIRLYDANPGVLEMYFAYLRAHALAGVGVRAIRWDRAPLGFGGEHMRRAVGAGVTSPEQRKAYRALLNRTFDAGEAHAGPGLVENLVRRILRQEEKRMAAAAPGAVAMSADEAVDVQAVGAAEEPVEHTGAESTSAVDALQAPTVQMDSGSPMSQATGKASATSANEPKTNQTPEPALEAKPEPPSSQAANEPDLSTAGPQAFVPEPEEESISSPASEPVPPVATQATVPEQAEAEPSTAGPASFTTEPVDDVSPALELDTEPSTAGPEEFIPEPEEDMISPPEATLSPDPVQPAAEPSTAGPATFIPESVEDVSAPLSANAEQNREPTTAGPEEFAPEPLEEQTPEPSTAGPATFAPESIEDSAPLPAGLAEQSAEPTTAGPEAFIPETTEEGISSPAGTPTPAPVQPSEQAEGPSTAGPEEFIPEQEEVSGTPNAPPENGPSDGSKS